MKFATKVIQLWPLHLKYVGALPRKIISLNFGENYMHCAIKMRFILLALLHEIITDFHNSFTAE